MIKQESTYYPDSFQMREFKEFSNSEVILHQKFDVDGHLYFQED